MVTVWALGGAGNNADTDAGHGWGTQASQAGERGYRPGASPANSAENTEGGLLSLRMVSV